MIWQKVSSETSPLLMMFPWTTNIKWSWYRAFLLIYVKTALSTIVADFPQPLQDEFIGLWMEYEEQKTLASNYVFDFDKLDMLVQAEEYESGSVLNGLLPFVEQGINLQEFFDSTEALFKTPYGKSVATSIFSLISSKSKC